MEDKDKIIELLQAENAALRARIGVLSSYRRNSYRPKQVKTVIYRPLVT
jgi:hypothetical protein